MCGTAEERLKTNQYKMKNVKEVLRGRRETEVRINEEKKERKKDERERKVKVLFRSANRKQERHKKTSKCLI